jgi:lipopolysaccharide exporter
MKVVNPMVLSRILKSPIILSNILYHSTLIFGTVITSRIYNPNEFGLFGSVVALIQLFGLVSAFRLDTAIVIPRSISMARAVLCVGFLCVICVAIALTSVLAFLQHFSLLNDLGQNLLFVPFGIVLVGFQQIQMQLALRLERFALVARALVTHGLVMISTQIILGNYGWDARGLIFGHLAGYVGANTVYFSGAIVANTLFPLPNLAKLILAVRKYFSFSALGSATTVFSSLGTYFPVLLLGQFASHQSAGLYLVASRITTAPIDFIGTGISQTLVGKIASRNRKNMDSRRQLYVLLQIMTVLGVATILTIGSLAPTYVEKLLGSEWAQAASFVRLLSIGAAAQFVAVPFSALFAVYRDQKSAFFQISSLTITRFVFFLAGISLGNETFAVAGFAVASWIGYTFLLRKFLKVSQVDFHFLTTYVLEFLAQLALFAATCFVLMWNSHSTLATATAVVIAVLNLSVQLLRVRKILGNDGNVAINA